MKSTNEQGCSDVDLDSPELDSLSLLRNLQACESLPRPQVSRKDTPQGDGGGAGRTWLTGERAVVDKGTAFVEGKQKGIAERGGRWRKMRSGALGRGRRMEGRRNGEDERRRHKRKKGRRQDRGQTELKLPRHPAASVINNKPDV
ncbi:hypothetical protein CesoFtcFv8_027064 [Champsocephalus esox]|uniref:Uncharacterized protein n=1 Tax=Champsocephalus esox TaxID=159716 RepID=A0AAN8B0C9_9TELE|nr:hypothetical protein CesoFtcFv8_027064 [Champsocephalus esox]